MRFSSLSSVLLPILAVVAAQHDQVIMSAGDGPFVPQTHSQPTLYDLLTIDPIVSIFFSYARDTDINERFQDTDAALTLLVPTNHAVMALPRKPHQGTSPDDTESGVEITEEEFQDKAKRNIDRWISAHVIPISPISFTSPGYPSLLPDRYISFKQTPGNPDEPEWRHVIIDEGVRIIGMKTASNGVLYIIDGTITID